MRILFTIHGYKPAYRLGGPITSVAALAEGLVARGNEVSVYTTNSNLDELLDVPLNQRTDVNGVNVYYYEFNDFFKQPFARRSRKPVTNNFLYSPAMRDSLKNTVSGFDVVHTHMPFIYPTLSAGRAAIEARKPFFYHQRGVFDPIRLQSGALKKRLYIELFEKPNLRRATTLFALTTAERDSYRALGIATPCTIIPNGIDASEFGSGPNSRLLEQFNLPADALLVLFMGRLHPIKGVQRLVDGFLKVAPAVPNAYLMLAGPDEVNMTTLLQKKIADAGFSGRVFFPGMITGDLKRTLLARADVFSLPSDAEGFSMAILEAMASGTAVQITPRCYFPEVASVGAGHVVEADSERIADDLAGLLKYPALLKIMGGKGKALVQAEYTWKNIVSKVSDAYLEGISRHGHQ